MAEPTPSEVEARTTEWVRDRLIDHVDRSADPDLRVFDPDGRPRRMSKYHFQSLQRKLKIFRWLDRMSFDSFVDIGSGFDHYPYLVRKRYGGFALYSDLNPQMVLPLDGERTGKLDRGVVLNIARLPFADGAFDVVLASEVLEHLVRPVEAVAELLRVARKALIVTSLEALSPDRLTRFFAHHRVDVRRPHVERNFFILSEIQALFGTDTGCENLLYAPALPAGPFEPEAVQERTYAAFEDRAALAIALCQAVSDGRLGAGAMGIMIVKAMPPHGLEPPRRERDRELADWLIEQAAALEQSWFDLVARWRAQGYADPPARDRPVSAELLDRVRCPGCRNHLESVDSGVRCTGCGASFAGEYGVPVLYPKTWPEVMHAEREALERICGADRPRRRVVRRMMRRLRRNESPPGRLRRALWHVGDRLTR